VLVVDIARQSASAAALVGGFASHRRDVTVAGVILNRAASPRHAEAASRAIASAHPGIALLGSVPRDASLALPERHLGLVQAGEHGALEKFLDHAAGAVAAAVDIPALLSLARPARLRWSGSGAVPPLPPLGRRIAVARDRAFAFAYPETLEGWRLQGAAIAFFSPLDDEAPGQEADAVYLPGGYPELHAGRLASAQRFKAGVKAVVERGGVAYGECGGYMALGQGLIGSDGARHAMLGLLPLESSFAQPKLHLGYRRAALEGESPLGKTGQALRGHEFHYASVVREGPGEPLFGLSDSAGKALGPAGRVARHGLGLAMGSFAHLIDRE
jgi:cobyrinic acid a,c-diamide synthase